MKKFIAILLLGVLCFTLCACNYAGYDFIDTNYHYDRAIIALPGGTHIEVEVEKWADAEDGEQLTITDTEGNVYLTSSYNCVLIEENGRDG